VYGVEEDSVNGEIAPSGILLGGGIFNAFWSASVARADIATESGNLEMRAFL